MEHHILLRSLAAVLALVGSLLSGSLVYADKGGLENFIGRWEVQMNKMAPEVLEDTYIETYAWTLDGKFLKGVTEGKYDGTHDVIYGTYEEKSDGYPFWSFSSSGTYWYLASGTYDRKTKTMEWQNPSGFDVNYKTGCVFVDTNTRHCALTMKDWKGSIINQLEWKATRLPD